MDRLLAKRRTNQHKNFCIHNIKGILIIDVYRWVLVRCMPLTRGVDASNLAQHLAALRHAALALTLRPSPVPSWALTIHYNYKGLCLYKFFSYFNIITLIETTICYLLNFLTTYVFSFLVKIVGIAMQRGNAASIITTISHRHDLHALNNNTTKDTIRKLSWKT